MIVRPANQSPSAIFSTDLVLSRFSGVCVVTAGAISNAGSTRLQRSEFGPFCGISPGATKFFLYDGPEQFRRFCPDCQEDTAHKGFDELGLGWYAQISHCRQRGRQGMRVWSLA